MAKFLFFIKNCYIALILFKAFLNLNIHMINNFDLIKTMLNFDNPDTMYFIQIFQRRKDIPELSKNCRKLLSYYIRSFDDFERRKESIIKECETRNARAYIDINAKDIKKVALYALKKTAEHIYNGEYDAVSNVYDTSCGNVSTLGKKSWILDIDTHDEETIRKAINQVSLCCLETALQRIVTCNKDEVDKLELETPENPIILPTKNGVHIVTQPFNCSKFEKIENVDIMKQGITLLYIK